MEDRLLINDNKESTLKESQSLPLWKMIVLFFTGWYGLKILAKFFNFIVLLCNEVPFWDAFNFTIDSNQITLEIYNILSRNDISMLVNSVCYGTLMIILFIIIAKDGKKIIKSFKIDNFFWVGLGGLFAILAFNRLYNFAVSRFYQIGDNANEQAIDSVVSEFPILSVFIFGIVGPLCEEITYRIGLFNSLKRKTTPIVTYILTALIFGLIHFNFDALALFIANGESATLINELLNLPIYIFAGLTFSYIYDKYGFAASFTAHTLNNLLSIVLQILLSSLL